MSANAGKTRPQQEKYYVICASTRGELTLTARATSEAEASKKIHLGYPSVSMVLDIYSAADYKLVRKNFRRSLISTAYLR